MLAALGNLGFRALIEFFSWLFRGFEWNALGIDHGGWYRALIPVILMSGGVAILLLNRIFPGDVLGYGFPNFLEMVNLGTAKVKRRWIFVKAAGASLSLGAGASVGREGPIAQIGGAIGSTIAQLRKLSPDRAKVLVAAGAGAGIATTFNAPIGGLMFAQEIVLLGHTEIANLTLLIIATFSAVITSRAIQGNAVVFLAPEFVLRSYWEMATYALMGACLGVLAAGYIRFFNATDAWFRRLDLPVWVKLHGRSRSRRRDCDLAAAKLVRRLPGDQRGDGGRVRHRDARRDDLREVFRQQRVARMRRAGRLLRPDLLHRHDGGRLVPARVGEVDSAPDGAARLLRAGRARRVSGRHHARAADGVVPALGDDAQRHDRACRR